MTVEVSLDTRVKEIVERFKPMIPESLVTFALPTMEAMLSAVALQGGRPALDALEDDILKVKDCLESNNIEGAKEIAARYGVAGDYLAAMLAANGTT